MAKESEKENTQHEVGVSIDLDTKEVTTFNVDSNASSILSMDTSQYSYEGTGIIDLSDLTENDYSIDEQIPFEGSLSKGIIGTDNRTQVTNTTSFPYRAIVYLEGKCENNHIHYGSGFMIGEDTVATAGHCVYDDECGWMSSIRVYPGKNGTSSPYGSTTAKTLNSVNGWVKNKDRSYDYGVIKLNSSIGNTVGWFGLSGNNSSIAGKNVTISGYPADVLTKLRQQWKHSGNIFSEVGSRRILYPIDTTGGQSGSPVYWYNSTYGYQAVGIHTAKYSSSQNNGTKITVDIYNYLNSHK